ncbi:MAG: major capsid protein [Longimicrobiales bacterium]
MKLKHRIKRWQVKRALQNNAGRIASVAAAVVGVAVGIRAWRSMRAH